MYEFHQGVPQFDFFAPPLVNYSAFPRVGCFSVSYEPVCAGPGDILLDGRGEQQGDSAAPQVPRYPRHHLRQDGPEQLQDGKYIFIYVLIFVSLILSLFLCFSVLSVCLYLPVSVYSFFTLYCTHSLSVSISY